jgi:hypothetical protein
MSRTHGTATARLGCPSPTAPGRESCRGLLLSRAARNALLFQRASFTDGSQTCPLLPDLLATDATLGQPDSSVRRDRSGCSSIDLAAKSWCRVWGRQPGTYKHRRPPRSLCRIQITPGVRAMASHGVVRSQIGHGAAQQDRVVSALSPCVSR